MSKEKFPPLLAPFLGVLLAFGTYSIIAKNRLSSLRKYHAPAPVTLAVSAASVIGNRSPFRGNTAAPYTLVEFGDFECPPCRLAYSEVKNLQSQYPGKIRFNFRHLPLEKLHPFARGAALAAESARPQGKFWLMHDALYESSPRLSRGDIDKIVARLKLNRSQYDRANSSLAPAAVSSDMQAAKEFHVKATPTFILCCPNHRVVKLGSLEQMNVIIKAK